MSLWTFALLLVAATALLALRSYLARTSFRLKVHLTKIDLLKPLIDDPIEIARGEAPFNSLNRLTAGFALSDSRSECLEGLKWLARAEDFPTDEGPRVPGRLKADFFAWLMLRDSLTHYLLALKFVRPQDLNSKALKKLGKWATVESFNLRRAKEFIERLSRK